MSNKLRGFLLLSFCLTALGLLWQHSAQAASSKIEKNFSSILVQYQGQNNIQTISIPPTASWQEILTSHQANPQVAWAEPDFSYALAATPNDKYYKNLWYLKRIKAEAAWDVCEDSPAVIIAVIDTGVQVDHPDLKNNIWVNTKEIPDNNIDDDNNGYVDDYYGYDFVNRSSDPGPKFKLGFTEDGVTHGTLIAGILAASGNNHGGVAGISWQAQIMALKALDDQGQAKASQVIEAINYAVSQKADIINLSFAGFDYSKGLQQAIRRAYDAGVLIVAAGGNEQSDGYGYFLDKTPMYPVCNDDPNGDNLVIGVAATGPLDQKAYFSSYGQCIDISAPGVSFFGAVPFTEKYLLAGQPFNKYYDGYWSGTSFAVPLVSGTLALMQQANPGLSPRELTRLLLVSADNIDQLNPQFVGQLGSGRLNMQKAVEMAKQQQETASARLLFAPQSLAEDKIKITEPTGKAILEFTAFKEQKTGLNLASGDLTGDEQAEIIAAPKGNYQPEVKIFDQTGQLQKSFLAYNQYFKNGVQVAVADVNNDGHQEIITAPGPGWRPEIRIFDSQGKLLTSFLAYAKNFSGGVNIAVGDTNADGLPEIITAPKSNGGAHIRVFNGKGKVLSQFFAADPNWRHGWQVATIRSSDYQQNGAKILVAPEAGLAPYVKIYTNQGQLIWRFGAFNISFAGGVNLSSGDLNNDGQDEIIATAGPGGAPHVRIFQNYGLLSESFYAAEENFNGGLTSAVLINRQVIQ